MIIVTIPIILVLSIWIVCLYVDAHKVKQESKDTQICNVAEVLYALHLFTGYTVSVNCISSKRVLYFDFELFSCYSLEDLLENKEKVNKFFEFVAKFNNESKFIKLSIS